MANTILKINHHNKAFHVLWLFSLLLCMQRVGATEFKVGGLEGWTVPTDSNVSAYNQWAEMQRFQIGDTLLFSYPADKDSVLQVNEMDYAQCNTALPIKVFDDGNTEVKFNQSGPYYFISGIEDHCLKNEKMVVIVMADRTNQSSSSNQTSSAYSPSPSPSPSGSVEIIPSPAPVESNWSSNSNETSSEAPSPPPLGSVEIIPSPAPVSEESPLPSPPPPSGTSSVFMSFISTIGAFVCSSLLLVL
ncbi:hypothetical protein HHK36_005598 [Tetracentron sinense]|uniref:Phytocyanin domain-containing protein n=1 Tax=Tetracentron sinense TaxID=13715 RepID=A0A834ZUH8_TETSI|nr:hypothetical protein HHK36_005598 [Tetracentron sinense]